MEKNHPLRLLCVLAHPDDESLALGGTLAKYAAEGVETHLVMATRGELGWQGEPAPYPGPLALGRQRVDELTTAAGWLGLRGLSFLDYVDGDLDCADPERAVAKIANEVRRVRPDVVITFGPDGVSGHPDHIAISQFTTAAVALAADSAYALPSGAVPHRTAKLYHRVWTADETDAYQAVFGDVGIDVAGVRRHWVSWPDWAITTRLDTADHWREVRAAVTSHRSQVGACQVLHKLLPEEHRRLWGTQHFYRAMSLVDPGYGLEQDLFAGLR
jgi:LmbE family N-acetylglucosaminyl deacetylase